MNPESTFEASRLGIDELSNQQITEITHKFDYNENLELKEESEHSFSLIRVHELYDSLIREDEVNTLEDLPDPNKEKNSKSSQMRQ